MTTCAVIIPSFNSGDILSECVSSVQRAASTTSLEIKTVVIDCHPDANDERISGDVDWYQHLPANPGFGSACNLGMMVALDAFEADWVFLLNPDAYLKEDIFSSFEAKYKTYQEGRTIVAPIILFTRQVYGTRADSVIQFQTKELTLESHDDQFQFYGGDGRRIAPDLDGRVRIASQDWIVTASTRFVAGTFLVSRNEGQRSPITLKISDLKRLFLVNNAGSEFIAPNYVTDLEYETLYIPDNYQSSTERNAFCGAGVFLSKEFIRTVGGFDERFFLYFEDVEYSSRALDRGFKIIMDPELIVFHHHSVSTGVNALMRDLSISESHMLFLSISNGISTSLFYLVGSFLHHLKLIGRSSRSGGENDKGNGLQYSKARISGFFKSLGGSQVITFDE